MTKFLVSGLINIETTLQVDGFPISYNPSRFPFFGINNTVSGVGYNIAKALSILGDEPDLLSFVGPDFFGRLARETLATEGIPTRRIRSTQAQTAQSIIAYDPSGRRSIFTDLKDAQEQVYPEDDIRVALQTCDIAVLCNINFSRPMLALAKALGKPVATDVHTISSLNDEYNRDFMAAADILFMSDENLPLPPERWILETAEQFDNSMIVIGLGSRGALMYTKADRRTSAVPAANVRPVVNTIGAGDALFSSFLHFIAAGKSPREALELAVVFAGYKVGANGAAEGFLPESELKALAMRVRAGQDR